MVRAAENKALKPNPELRAVRAGEAGAPAGLCAREEPPFPLRAPLLGPSGGALAPRPASRWLLGRPAPGASHIHPKQQSHKLILQMRDLQAANASEMDSRLRLAFS